MGGPGLDHENHAQQRRPRALSLRLVTPVHIFVTAPSCPSEWPEAVDRMQARSCKGLRGNDETGCKQAGGLGYRLGMEITATDVS